MCQSRADGGARCAAHTRKGYRTAIDAILEEPDFTAKTALLAEHRDAVIAYAATPSGAKDFTIESTWMAENAAKAATKEGSVQAAAAEFEAAVGLAQIQAQIRGDVNRDVLRTLKHARTGTHAGAGVSECAPMRRDGNGLTIDPDDYAAAMKPGQYQSGNAVLVDWCDYALAHHGHAPVHAPWENEPKCLHCMDAQADAA